MKRSLGEILILFTGLGMTAFGGPVAHLAMMRHEFVERRKWLGDTRFVELIGLTNLIPGPNSTEMAIHLGYERGGLRGSIVAGCGFIIPAVAITLGVAWFYRAYGSLPAVQGLLFGIKPAIIAVILFAIVPLFKTAVTSYATGGAAIVTFALCLLGFSEVLVMLGMGLSLMLYEYLKNNSRMNNVTGAFPVFLLQSFFAGITVSPNLKLFLIFLKIGSILYGSGYVLFAFLDAELVQAGYMSRAQLIDAVAVGQITPGPVFSAVTFIGYQINGLSGALVSTVAIFLPSFVFVIATHSILPRLRKSALFSAFLGGVNAASMAIMLYALAAMSRETFTHWSSFAIAIFAVTGLWFFRNLGSVFVVLFGALCGFFLMQFALVHPGK